MSVSTSLPSPNSRRSTDPSNRPVPPDFAVEVTPDAGDAVILMPLFGALVGVPQCRLTGGGHAVGLLPLTATQSGIGAVTLHFAEPVAGGDVLTWPEKDPAIRARNGSYVAPMSYTAAGSPATNPIATSGSYDAATQQLTLTFDQDITAPGPTIAGIIFSQTTDGVTMISVGIISIVGPTIVISTTINPVLPFANGTSESSGLGAVIVGTAGGLPANELGSLATPQDAYTVAPLPLKAEDIGGGNILIYWNVTVTDNGTITSVFYTDAGFNTFSNAAPTSNSTATITKATCAVPGAPGPTPSVLNTDPAIVTSPESGVDNDPLVDFPVV